MATVWLEAAVGLVRCCGFPWGRGSLSPADLFPSEMGDTPWLPPPALLELSGAVKCRKDIPEQLCLSAESSMDYRKITFIKIKRLLAFTSALVTFTLQDTGYPPALVLSTQLETGQ